MTRRLPLLIGALAFGSAVSVAGVAEAGHVHFGGGVHVSGGVHVGASFHWSRPAGGYYGGYGYRQHWGVGGHVWVGGYTPYYYRPYYYYYPEYVPSYYGTTYYPVQAYAAPGVATVVAPRPELPRFGIGLFAGGVSSDLDTASNTSESDVGLLGRFRLSEGLLIEGELGKTAYSVNNNDNVRVDRRLGGALVYEFGAYNTWAPFVLVGLGVQQASVGDNYKTTQDYGELGGGIRFAITPHFHLMADVRAGTRSTVSNDSPTGLSNGVARTVAPPTSTSNQNEDYTRVRLTAMLYF